MNDLQEAHLRIKIESVEKFRSFRKMGGDSLSDKYLDELESEINHLYDIYRKLNDGKNGNLSEIVTAAALALAAFAVKKYLRI